MNKKLTGLNKMIQDMNDSFSKEQSPWKGSKQKPRELGYNESKHSSSDHGEVEISELEEEYFQRPVTVLTFLSPFSSPII